MINMPGFKICLRYLFLIMSILILFDAKFLHGSNQVFINQYTYQAEEGTVVGNILVENEHDGFHGSGYLNFPLSDGVVGIKNIDGGEGGSAIILIRYSLEGEARSGTIKVNDVSLNKVFASTSSWTSWIYTEVSSMLNPGTLNSIEISSTGNDLGNVDEIIVLPAGVDPFVKVSDSVIFINSLKGDQKTFEIISNAEWELATEATWYTVSPGSGIEYALVNISSLEDNINPAERIDTLRIAAKGISEIKIPVIQAGMGNKSYYIDDINGNDELSGLSQQEAWQSIEKVSSMVFGPGDSVLFKRGGSWKGKLNIRGAGTKDQPLVISSYGEGNEKPFIHANGNDEAVILVNTENIIFEHFELSNPALAANRKARGIYIYGDQSKCFENITIRNNTIHDVIGWVRPDRRWSSGGIFTETIGDFSYFKNILIEGNHIYDCTTRGITGSSAATNWEDTTYMNDRLIIRNNLIENTGCDAIRTIAAKNILVEYNTVYHCGNYTLGEEPQYIAACFPQQCGNSIWQYNEIAYTAPTKPPAGDMDSQAFDIDHECVGTHIFQYNYTHDNYGGFFLFMGEIVEDETVGPFKEAILRYNISENDGYQFPRIFEFHDFKTKAFDIKVYNNVFYYDEGNMTIQLKGGNFNGLQFYNNVFYAPKGYYNPSIVYDHNLYYGHGAPSVDLNGINEDPLFMNPGKGGEGIGSVEGYKIRAGSPAIRNGMKISDQEILDYWGNKVPVDMFPDIGAHQFSNDTITVGEEKKSLVDNDQLGFVCFPNPCKDRTYIEFSLKAKSEIGFYVYDLNGRLVKAHESEVYFPGNNEVELDLRGVTGLLLSGLFLIQCIDSGNQILDKKLILIDPSSSVNN